MFTFLTALSTNVVVGWIIRRVFEVGGWLAFAVSAIAALPPAHQATVIAILTGQGGGLSVSALFGLIVYIASQVWSYRTTVRPQVVADGRKIGLTEEEARQAVYEQTGRYPTKPVWRR